MNTIAKTVCHGIDVRLVQRASDYVILFIDINCAAIWSVAGDYGQAVRRYDQGVELAQSGFPHPAWRQQKEVRHVPICQS